MSVMGWGMKTNLPNTAAHTWKIFKLGQKISVGKYLGLSRKYLYPVFAVRSGAGLAAEVQVAGPRRRSAGAMGSHGPWAAMRTPANTRTLFTDGVTHALMSNL